MQPPSAGCKMDLDHISDTTCPHIYENKKLDILQNLWMIRKIFLYNETEEISQCYKNCMSCKKVKSTLACLECAYTSCSCHVNHDETHFLFADLSLGQIFCIKCNTFIFISEYILRNPLGAKIDPSSIQMIKEHALEVENTHKTIGLRGLVNLYNTCFANCIIQAFLHIPMMRSFFLSGVYSCCDTPSDDCFMCLFSNLYDKSYNGENSVFSPHEFLTYVWRESPQFNLVEQHDAHEFFIRILDSIRKFDVIKNVDNGAESPNSDNNTVSNSIVDMAFFGTIESEIKCSVCSASLSKILEPFCDLSLEIYSQSDKLIRNTSNINLNKNGSNPITLEKCLNLFTKTELLGSDGRRTCDNCQKQIDSSKEIKISKLPMIFSFHFKRFEHNVSNSYNSTSTKVNNHISFAKTVDMRPYLTKENFSSFEDTTYTLICVVNHQGDLEGGHYTCYVTDGYDRWYNCDDTEVTLVNEDEVYNSQAYLLFYQKNTINFI